MVAVEELSYVLVCLFIIIGLVKMAKSSTSSYKYRMFSWVHYLAKHDQLIIESFMRSTFSCRKNLPVFGSISHQDHEAPSNLSKDYNATSALLISPNRRPRPPMLQVPEFRVELSGTATHGDNISNNSDGKVELENVSQVEGDYFCLVGKKGGRKARTEDRHGVITNISGNPKQAYFSVIDGHGGHAAADYVANNLGNNILKAIDQDVGTAPIYGENNSWQRQIEDAITKGHTVTDQGFLSQGVGSGACVASLLVKDAVLFASNVGDCRAVLSRNGSALRLTNDHRPNRNDERSRVEALGGCVQLCRGGVWRVQGCLAVSRAIGDLHLKPWVTSQPEITVFPLHSDCDFLIIASDGLWDKVEDQEAIDIVSQGKVDRLESCKKLVKLSSDRGSRDDITVMIVNLHSFLDR